MKPAEKIENRKIELLTRTSEIFNISPEEAEKLFTTTKSAVIKITDEANSLINQNIEKGNLSPLGWLNDAYIINQNKSIFTKSTEFEKGQIYIQNISSLLPVIALDPQPNEIILDMCAAPGGKTIQIARLSNNQAQIIVNDENPTRVQAMKKLFNTFNIKINSYFSQPSQYLSKHLPSEYFDKILLDAPCSGEGLIDLNKPESLQFWSTKKIKRLNHLQKNMIAEAYKLLKPQGTLVYSTCTLAPEENEEVISWALENFAGLKTEEISITKRLDNSYNGSTSWKGKTLNSGCQRCIRVKPNDHMEAFFVCKLIKS